MQKNVSLIPAQSFTSQVEYFWLDDLCSCIFLVILVRCFFCCCIYNIFFILFLFVVLFLFSFFIFAIFVRFYFDFTIFMFMFFVTHLYWHGLFTKKDFIRSLSSVSVTVLHVQRFTEAKIPPTDSLISADSLFLWLLLAYWKVIALLELPVVFCWVSVESTFLSSVPSFRSVVVPSIVFVSVIVASIICLVRYLIFLSFLSLLRSLTPLCCGSLI